MSEHLSTPRRYYDRLTRLFLALGSNPRAQSIHRAVWDKPGMRLEDALNSVNARILAELSEITANDLWVADLGCGVGGSLFYLLRSGLNPARVVGLTISAVQAGLALDSARRQKMKEAAHFVVGDYLALPLRAGFDFAYSIEAFVHTAYPELYFTQAAALLRAGGRLVICDDFLQVEADVLSVDRRRMAAMFQRGWQATGLRTVETTIGLAAENGFSLLRCDDLTAHLRLRAVPDGLANTLAKIEARLRGEHTLLRNLLGSIALQQCLRDGITGYYFLVFEKRADA